MAHPTCVAEETFRLFMQQWYHGLQPKINLTTESDGAITVALQVTSLPAPQLLYCRRSGQLSRQRRQAKRAHLFKSAENAVADNELTDNVADTVMIINDQPSAQQCISSPPLTEPSEEQTSPTDNISVISVDDKLQTNLPEQPFHYPSEQNTTIHEVTTVPPSPQTNLSWYLCVKCSEAFNSIAKLEEHKESAHDGDVPEFFPFICDGCNQSFEPDDFNDHLDSGCR